MIKAFSLCLTLICFLSPLSAVADGYQQSQDAIEHLVQEVSITADWKSEDIHLLAKVIHGEARGESYWGKIAVGAVVINRLHSPEFPNTLKEVVYQPYAFTCIQDGQIELVPDLDSYRAAFDAILGSDPTSGCLFYCNPKTATSRWMRERKSAPTISIGNHIFMK